VRKLRRCVCLTLLLGLAGSLSSRAQVPLKPGDEYVEIDGGKNPGDIPEWSAWETSFRNLALAKRKGSVAIPRSLKMSEADQKLVFAEAMNQAARDQACDKRVDALRPLVGKVDNKTIWERNWEILIDCRQATLDAGQQLLKQLSPEAQVAMQAWVAETKRHIWARIPKSEIDHYRRPY
jgi:hypothetical protein